MAAKGQTLGPRPPASANQSHAKRRGDPRIAEQAALENIKILDRNAGPGLRKALKINLAKAPVEDRETEEAELPHCMAPKSETARVPVRHGAGHLYFAQGTGCLDQADDEWFQSQQQSASVGAELVEGHSRELVNVHVNNFMTGTVPQEPQALEVHGKKHKLCKKMMRTLLPRHQPAPWEHHSARSGLTLKQGSSHSQYIAIRSLA